MLGGLPPIFLDGLNPTFVGVYRRRNPVRTGRSNGNVVVGAALALAPAEVAGHSYLQKFSL